MFHAHLKTIEVGEFAGQQDEFSALKILVKNAMVLEKVDLVCSTNLEGGPEKKTEITKQLTDLPRGPESSEIEIVLH
ncbi:hypothetical protein D8674_002030 [Pyrus ussuriensis x Pyrus communis]|uniref:FBD domain-containing protein n=1 Tax=Pyrus ussuriensis x Pyrus communis TaxID=2448454 RepID=A0A5N5FD51_9ROSA|nr:hypothetical protein D8674_002030 [Pyrus ussuriensis x Pyrus communis]